MRYDIAVTGFGGILGLALQLLKHNLVALCLFGALLSLPGLGASYLQSETQIVLPTVGDVDDVAAYLEAVELPTVISKILMFIQNLLLLPVAVGAMVVYMAGDVTAQPMSWGRALGRAWSQKWALLLAAFLLSLCLRLGMYLLFVPSIYFALRFGLFIQACVLEGAQAVDAMRRSGTLMRSHYWIALALYGALVVGLLGANTGLVEVTASPVQEVVTWLVQVLCLVLLAAVTTALFFAARTKEEQNQAAEAEAEEQAEAQEPAETEHPQSTSSS